MTLVSSDESRNRLDYFPDSTSWGVAGFTGKAGPWRCPSCGCTHQLIVWKGLEVTHRQCNDCWWNGAEQLTLFSEQPPSPFQETEIP